MTQIPLFQIVARDDLPIKVDMASLEHALFSVTKQPLREIRLYAVGKDHEIRIIPSVLGGPTIHDKDILVYCASQLIEMINDGVKVEQTILVNPFHLLKTIGRNTGGKDYQRLTDALTRLRGTTIETKIRTGGVRQDHGFGLIDSWEFVTTPGRQWAWLQIGLSDWYFRAIMDKEVLTVDSSYFSLEGREKRIYEILRKHVGRQKGYFRIGLELLREKCGSASEPKRFKFEIQKIITKVQCDKQEGRWHPLNQFEIALCGDILVASLSAPARPLKIGANQNDLKNFGGISSYSNSNVLIATRDDKLCDVDSFGVMIGALPSIKKLVGS